MMLPNAPRGRPLIRRRATAARALTAGEIALARRVFKDAIDYGKVRVHNRKYIFFQRDNSGMAPNGDIYVVGDRTYCSDYARTDIGLRRLFIHEMAHVWQYQCKILRPVRAAVAEACRHRFDYAKAYAYELAVGKDLRDYRIEQQAKIIEDYYAHALAQTPAHATDTRTRAVPPLYTQVLARFLANPRYA